MKNKHIYQDWLSLSQLENSAISKNCFLKVEKQYTQHKRHYHSLLHIQNLFDLIKESQLSKIDKKYLAHAALFHDVVYISTAKDNESQSAQFATVWLNKLGIDTKSQKIIVQLIIATATHTSNDPLTQLFLDMDMSILGCSQSRYQQYCSDIRKEYSDIPLFLYTQGRKRFLKKTLKRSHIFLTDYYQEYYEKQARINMKEELSAL